LSTKGRSVSIKHACITAKSDDTIFVFVFASPPLNNECAYCIIQVYPWSLSPNTNTETLGLLRPGILSDHHLTCIIFNRK
jgi:hypothetical protein